MVFIGASIQKRSKLRGITLAPYPSADPEENKTFADLNKIKKFALLFGLLGLIGSGILIADWHNHRLVNVYPGISDDFYTKNTK